MAYDIGPKIGIDGEAEFRAQIKAISTNVRTLGTEMEAVTSAFIGQEKSAEALSAKNQVLAKTVSELDSKLELQKKMLADATATYGEADTRTQQWQQAVNKTTAELNKANAQIDANEQALQEDGKTVVDTAEKHEGAMSKIGAASKAGLGAATDALKGLATATAAAVGAATVAVAGLVKESVAGYGEFEQLIGGVETLFGAGGKSLEEYAQSVGKSVGEVEREYIGLNHAQGMVFENAANAFKTAGLSANEYMETVTSSAASLVSSLNGDTEAAAILADLAITDMADNANKMGSSMESIQNAYQGFAKQNYTMLDNLKLGYGGTKEEMQRLLADAEKLSGVEYDISSYADIAEAIHVVQTEMGITGTTAQEAATTIQGSVSAAKSAWTNLVTGLGDENANLEQLTGNFVDAVTTAGNNVIPAVEQILAGIGQAVQQLAPILVEQLPPLVSGVLPDLIDAGMILLTGVTEGITAALPELAAVAVDVVNHLTGAMSENLPLLLDASLAVIVTLAGGITDSLPELIPTIVDVVLQIVETLIDNADQLIDAALEIILALADGLIEALPRLLEKAPVIIEKLVNAIAENLPKILQAGIELIVKLAAGVIQNIPTLVKAVPEVIGALIAGFANYYKNLLETGKNLAGKVGEGIKNIGASAVQWGRDLIDNFVSGITNAIGKVKDAVSNVASTVKDFLGFSEPEKGPLSNFHTYAPDMMQLFAKGITDNAGLLKDAFGRSLDFQSELGDVQRKLDRSMAELAGNASATVRVSGSVAGSQEAGISSSVLAELPALIAEAVHKEFEGMGVYLQMRKVGEMTSQWQANNARAMGV